MEQEQTREPSPKPTPDASAQPTLEQAAASDAAEQAQLESRMQQITDLETQVKELNDRLLRAVADYQNALRRGHANAAEAREQQLLAVCKPLLGVLDHFDRALEADPGKVSAESLLQGVRIVRDELGKVMEGFGVKRIAVRRGDEFDPRLHEAMMQQTAEGVASHQVVQELAPGYLLGERTLRPAKVVVAP